MWFLSSFYDSSHGYCDSNYESMKTILGHYVILIRVMGMCVWFTLLESKFCNFWSVFEIPALSWLEKFSKLVLDPKNQ